MSHNATLQEQAAARQQMQAERAEELAELQTVLREGRIGEIISHVYGDERLQELFEQQGGIPEALQGKPAGIIAVEMGIVTADEKNALLAAQAAARTVDALETDRPRELNDEIFKWVGSPRDPEILQKSQSVMMAANHFNGREEAFDSFKAAAAESLKEASTALQEAGRTDIAAQFGVLAKDIEPQDLSQVTPVADLVQGELSRGDLSEASRGGLERVDNVLGALEKTPEQAPSVDR